MHKLLPRTLGTVALGAALGACFPPPVNRGCDFDAAVHCPNLNDPEGRIEGTLIYDGPPPGTTMTAQGPVATGRVILLLFDYNNPPPPDGSATTAIVFQTVSASQLFDGAQVVSPGRVRASIAYSFPGIPRAGVFQIRAFYSKDESLTYTSGSTVITSPTGFHPLFSVRNLPVQGDVEGGALLDPLAALPAFVPIQLGNCATPDGGGQPVCSLPETGSVTRNVTVFVGARLATERPQFHIVTHSTTVMDPVSNMSRTLDPPRRMDLSLVPDATTFACADGFGTLALDGTSGNLAPSRCLWQYASEWGLLPPGGEVLEMRRNPVITDTAGGSDLPSFTMRAGLPPPSAAVDECAIAALAGVRCAADAYNDIGFTMMALDRNNNGTIDLTRDTRWADAHPTLLTTNLLASHTNGRLPWLYPLVLLVKLHEPSAAERRLLELGQNGHLTAGQLATLRNALNQPETLDLSDPNDPRYPVIVFGAALPREGAANLLLGGWIDPGRRVTREPFPRVAIVPVGIEIHGPDQTAQWWGVVPPSLASFVTALTPFLPPNYRCSLVDPAFDDQDPYQTAGIPRGRYAVNVLSPGGQAWSLPNDLSTFGAPPNNPASATVCPSGQCAAPSQAMMVRIVAEELPQPGLDVRCPDPPTRTFP